MLNHLHHSNQTTSSGSLQGWRNIYDPITAFFFGGREQSFRAETIRLAQIQPGSRVLDIGCGTGTLTIAAARAAGPNGRVWGIDIAPDLVDLARQKAARAGLTAQFQVGSITNLPFEDGQLDVVLSSLMLHHLPDDQTRRAGLAEVRRVLRPGGTLLIAEFNPPQKGLLKPLLQMLLGSRMMRLDNQRLVGILEELGCRVEVLPARSGFITHIRAIAP